MKKSVILLASAILVMSCDLPAGGNKRVLKKTDPVVAYDDPNAPHGTYKLEADSAKTVQPAVLDSTKLVKPEAKPAVSEEPKTIHK